MTTFEVPPSGGGYPFQIVEPFVLFRTVASAMLCAVCVEVLAGDYLDIAISNSLHSQSHGASWRSPRHSHWLLIGHILIHCLTAVDKDEPS